MNENFPFDDPAELDDSQLENVAGGVDHTSGWTDGPTVDGSTVSGAAPGWNGDVWKEG